MHSFFTAHVEQTCRECAQSQCTPSLLATWSRRAESMRSLSSSFFPSLLRMWSRRAESVPSLSALLLYCSRGAGAQRVRAVSVHSFFPSLLRTWSRCARSTHCLTVHTQMCLVQNSKIPQNSSESLHKIFLLNVKRDFSKIFVRTRVINKGGR